MSDGGLVLVGLLSFGVVLLVGGFVWRRRRSRGSSGRRTTGQGATWSDPAGVVGGFSAVATDTGGPVFETSDFEVRSCHREMLHKPHYWGEADIGDRAYRCPGVVRQFFYRDWEREVRRFHPPGPDQIQAARRMLTALDAWEEMPDTAGSRWALKFLNWLAAYETPAPDK